MKVLQVGLSFNPGGIESFVMTYYRKLSKQGVRFDFISMFPHLAYEEEIKSLGGKVFHTCKKTSIEVQQTNEKDTSNWKI